MEVGRPRILALAALALVLAAPLAADVVQADDHVDEDEPHVLVRVENEGAQEREAEITIEGPTPWSGQARVGAHETWEHRRAGEPGSYHVEVVHEDEDSRARGSTNAVTEGCQGPSLTTFTLTDTGGISVRGGGCQGEVAAFPSLLEEALEALSADGDGLIDIPLPMDASQGRMLLWDDVAEPDWEEAAELPFAWIANASFHDERGRTVEGVELAYITPYHAEGQASGPLFEAEASSEDMEDRVRYAPGDPDPVSRTRPASSTVSSSPSSASAELRWEIRYDPPPGFGDCLLRNAQQGNALEASERLDGPCLAAGEEITWWTGEQRPHRGFTTIVQYGVDDLEEPSGVVKLVWADGLPYPIEAEMISANDGDRRAMKLTNLTQAGQPLAEEPMPREPAPIPQAPLAPLEGPALRGADRVPLPLAEASQAAQQDPRLTELQDLLANDEAILAGASLAPDEDTDAGEARVLTWVLAYTAPDEGPVLVACQRPTGHVQGTILSPPSADCRELDRAPSHAEHLRELPAVGLEALPSQSATWDAALDRWRLLDPGNASAPLELASYDPIADQTRQAPREAQLMVGTPGQDAQAGPSEASQAPATVAIALDDGETIAHTTGVKSHQGLTDPAAALSSTAAAGPGGARLLADADPLVGAAAGASLLGLLALAVFALYSRLQDEEVLAHDTRRQIRDLVEAEPGIHASAIARRVDANDRTVEHHIDVLVREDVLTVLERGGYNHHFVQGQHTPKEMQALASLQRGRAEEVYEAVRQDPGVDLSTLADRAGISKPYASKLVSQLVCVGLVDRVREGRSARLYANELRA